MQIGIYGSVAHILTNKKVEDKKGCLKDLTKENFKDLAKMIAVPAGVAGAAAGVIAVAPHVEKVFERKIIGYFLGPDVLTKFKGLPALAKAAITAAGAALAVVFPIMGIANTAHGAKVESQHEVK